MAERHRAVPHPTPSSHESLTHSLPETPPVSYPSSWQTRAFPHRPVPMSPRLALAALAATLVAVPLGAQPRLNGPWHFTFTQPDGRTMTTRVTVAQEADGRWSAWSREGAAGEMVSGPKAILGRMLGKLPPRGALLNVEGGRLAAGGAGSAGTTVTARLVSPFTGNRWLVGTMAGGRITGEMRRDSAGPAAGTFEGVPAPDARPLRDYRALAGRVRQALADSLFDPHLLERPEWRGFLRGLDERLARATDDLDAMAAFYALKPRLGISHVEFFRNPTLHGLPMDSLLARYANADPATLVRLTFPAPGVAYLRVDRWNAVTPWVDSAFVRIDSARPRTLVIDVRGNPGGDVSAISPAMHLARDSQPVGVFLGRRWFQVHRTPPARDTLRFLATADEHGGAMSVLGGVRDHGAVVGVMPPRAPFFGGEVFLLVDRRSGSASEPLAHHLRVTGRATLIGERTAGAMLSAPPHSIGDGWMLVLPEADYYAADGTRLEGNGVPPHVATTSADAPLEVARRVQARDPYAGALMLGNAHAGASRWAEAGRRYTEAQRLAPDSSAPVYGLAQVYTGRQQWAPAIAAWERVLVARPGDLGALYQLGRSAALSGTHLERGEAALRAYLERSRRPELPTHAAAHWRLGQILLARGDREGARREWEEALRLDPKSADVRKSLEELK